MLRGIEFHALHPGIRKIVAASTFHKWYSKHERSGTAGRTGMSDINWTLVKVIWMLLMV